MGTTAFNEDGVKFFDLSLSTSESTKLYIIIKIISKIKII